MAGNEVVDDRQAHAVARDLFVATHVQLQDRTGIAIRAANSMTTAARERRKLPAVDSEPTTEKRPQFAGPRRILLPARMQSGFLFVY